MRSQFKQGNNAKHSDFPMIFKTYERCWNQNKQVKISQFKTDQDQQIAIQSLKMNHNDATRVWENKIKFLLKLTRWNCYIPWIHAKVIEVLLRLFFHLDNIKHKVWINWIHSRKDSIHTQYTNCPMLSWSGNSVTLNYRFLSCKIRMDLCWMNTAQSHNIYWYITHIC